jgi:putative inorganic carbon (HCO3(-)) transporter
VIALAGLTLLFIYTLALGGTFNGILQPDVRLWNAIGLGALALVWGVTRRGRPFRQTPLDGAALLWLIALAVSLALNLDVWRRSATSLWHVGLYIGVWYVLHDLLARKVITRRALLDALLFAGVVVIAFGFVQLRGWLAGEGSLPRPVSTLGNANSLAGLLVLLLPVAASRWIAARLVGRVALTIYLMAAGILLLLTASRGGWIGAAAGVAAVGLLATWASSRLRRLALVVSVLVIAAVAVGALVLATQAGRTFDTRLWIYEIAWRTFAEQPLAGSGLYTFGRDLARFASTPMREPHAHAHNIVLHVAAELGIVGLIALVASLALIAWVGWRVWRTGADRALVIGAFGGCAGFFVHHLFDVPSMMPALALMGIAVLVAATHLPDLPARRLALPVSALCAALVVSAMWGALVYRGYVAAVRQEPPAVAAAAVAPILAADPEHAVYHYTQGMLWGMAGDAASSRAAFERFLALEPDYPMGWVNMAAMAMAQGDQAGALRAWTAASERGESAWSIHDRWGRYAESVGALDEARSAYSRAVLWNPDVLLLPDWEASPLRREAALNVALTPAGEAVSGVLMGDPDGARAAWEGSSYRASPPSFVIGDGIDALIALADGDTETAQRLYASMSARVIFNEDRAWMALIGGRLSGVDPADAVREALFPAGLAEDWSGGANIFYVQFLTLAYPRIFLPQAQIDTSYTGVLLLALIESPPPA